MKNLHYNNMVRLIVEILLVIIIAEMVVMFVLPYLVSDLVGWRLALLDGVLLAILAGPLILMRCRAANIRTQGFKQSDTVVQHDRASWHAVAIVLLGVPTALVIAAVMSAEITSATEHRFNVIVRQTQRSLTDWAYRPVYALKGAAGMFNANDQIDRSVFRDYVASRDWADEFPGVRVVGMLNRVGDADIPAFVDAQRADDCPEFEARPIPGVDEHWLVRFAEPGDESSGLLGLDICINDQVQAALRRAVENNEPQLTPGVNLSGGEAIGHEMLWLVPVYVSSAQATTPEERWASLDGVLFASFSLDGLKPILKQALFGYGSLKILDETGVGQSSVILDLTGDLEAGRALSSVEPERATIHRIEREVVGGRSWTLVIKSTPAFTATISRQSALVVAIGGSILALALAGVYWSISSSHKYAVMIARRMSDRVHVLSMVAEKTSNSVIVTDAQERIDWVNDGFTRISGYTLDEVKGNRPSKLLQCEKTNAETKRKIREALDEGLGHRSEILNRGKDGREYWIETDIQPVRDDDGLITHYIAVQTDLTERKSVECAMRKARDAAEAAYDAKSRFLAAMSHEIRTPLNGIIGFADLLRRGADNGDQAQRDEWISVIHGSGKHLLSLLNDVLDLAKMDVDGAEITPGPCNPKETIYESSLLLQSRAEEKGIGLSVNFDDNVPDAIRTDATRLRQIIMNLVANAVKFTESGGVEINVRLGDNRAEPTLEVAVRDTGIGMTPEQVSRLFKQFQQADKTIAERFGGTGLGLEISKRLAQGLGGDITVTSAEGVGSVFTLEIAAPPLHEDESLQEVMMDWSQAAAGRSDTEDLLKGRRILVADDVEANRMVCRLFLEQVGAIVTTVNDGREAVDAWRGGTFDLVLMDVQMPEVSGLEATKTIRDSGGRLPVIALTAFSGGSDRKMCFAAGMDDVLIKPFESEVLIQTVKRWVQRSADSGSVTNADSMIQDDDEDCGINSALAALARDWLNKLPDTLDALLTSVDEGDLHAVERAGHAIKGSAGSIGLPEFTESARALEDAALEGDEPGVRMQIAQLQAIHTEANARLARKAA